MKTRNMDLLGPCEPSQVCVETVRPWYSHRTPVASPAAGRPPKRAILDEGNDDGSRGRDCGTWHGARCPMDVPSSFGPRGQGVPEF